MRGARTTLTAGAALACALLVGGLVFAPSARGAITGSQITTPTDPSFFVADEVAPAQTFAISGSTSGGDPASDKVAVRCYFGASSVRVKGNVPLDSDGSFSVPAADLNTILDQTCHLRAVPAGTTPSDTTPFTGPMIGVGERNSSVVSGGPNNGKTYDYYFDAQQLTAAFDYASLGNCGLDDGYLYDSTYANTTITFACNAGLTGADSPGAPTRSELQIDGANAYPPFVAYSIINSDAAGLPSLTDTYTVDTATGNVVIHETDPLVKCPQAAYPLTTTSCSSFVSAGVTDDRTITQDHDGHVAWISDSFTSTDDAAHSLDLLWDNRQRFWGPSGNSAQLEYEFPGQSGFSTFAAGANEPLPPAPGTIFVRMHGAADGDMTTGQGAIVYDRPAASAEFTSVQVFASVFTLHQVGSVPAGGSTRFRFAYVQDYHAATVASLAQTASVAFLNTITVSRSGKGKGKVTSAPGGISCGTACTHGYAYGTSVTLKARPAKGSKFSRWSGACTGGGTCTITTNDNVAVDARFVLRPCVVPKVVGKSLKAAKRAIKRAFCSVGRITRKTSNVAKGHVVSQRPKHGRRLKQHGKVSLVVSKG